MNSVASRLLPLVLRIRHHELTTVLLFGVALGLAAWPVLSITPTGGLDPSWGAALHLAARQGLHFGSELIFTYGPLGFLTIPELYFPATAGLSLAYIAAFHFSCAVSIVALSARSLPRWTSAPAAAIAVFALAFVPISRLPVVLLLLWAVVVLRGERSGRLIRIFPWAAGFLSAFTLLMKFNDGVATMGIATITVVVLARRESMKALAIYPVVTVASFLVLWLMLGQRLVDIVPFIVGSLATSDGYSETMGFEDSLRAWEYGAAAIMAGLVALSAWSATVTWTRLSRAAVALVVAGVTWLAFKHGFVRHDGHSVGYFAMMLLVLVPFARAVPSARAAAFAFGLLAMLWTTNLGPTDFFNPLARIDAFVQEVQVMTSPDRRLAVMESSRTRMIDEYALDDTTLELLRNQRVHVYPQEVGVIWAHYDALVWAPLPVFQAYSAYTAYLDDLNAAKIQSDGAPDWLLREDDLPIDGRNRAYESPASIVSIICRYREVRATDRWQLLRRGEDRCGEPRLLAVELTTTGVPVEVPLAGPNEVVYARIHGVRDGALEGLRALLYKSDPVSIQLSGVTLYRLVPGTAGNPLVMATPASLGYSPPWDFGTRTDSLNVLYPLLPGPSSPDPLTVEFFAVELAP